MVIGHPEAARHSLFHPSRGAWERERERGERREVRVEAIKIRRESKAMKRRRKRGILGKRYFREKEKEKEREIKREGNKERKK